MLPTLVGRIQTRLFLVLVVGGIWTLLITPLIGAGYGTTFLVLITLAVVGVGWELIYHFIQQFRWEKDWPTLFGLVTAVPEGILLYLLLTPPVGVFLLHFLTTWIIVWLMANGPMRVPFVHWRFRGGRLI
ncbi:MAG: hypothetical protein H7Y15_11395 [Pseudonocardia sp.]|nr:hypothetical protein [Pseudonocardia sp.]